MSPAIAPTPEAQVFAALGDEQRLALLERLGRQEESASALAVPMSISRQAVIKHLKVLQSAGLVDTRRSGREVLYQVRAEGLQQPTAWLTDHAAAWRRRLRDVKARAEALEPRPPTNH